MKIKINKHIIPVLILTLTILTSCDSILLGLSGEKSAEFKVEGNKAYINGVLGKKAHKSFMKILKKHPNIKTIVLQQVPGSISDEWNVKTCKEIRKRGINTYLESTSIIQSGGVDLFIAGVKRFSENGSKIGVHAWSDLRRDGNTYPPDHKEHDIFVDYFKAIKRDTAFYWFTLKAAPANGMHFMTKQEIEKYNLVTNWINKNLKFKKNNNEKKHIQI